MKHDFTLADVQGARRFLARFLETTPVKSAPSLSRDSGADLRLKLECELPTGSFKVRGALFALSCVLREQSPPAVVTSSTGNHGAAVAYAAKLLGIPARVFVPFNSNPLKRAKIADLGAEIAEQGADLSEASAQAAAYAARTGAYYLSDALNPLIPVATATIGCEIVEQVPEVAAVYVPVGDSALIRGLAHAAKTTRSSIRIIGVQAERAPSYYLSWKAGAVISTDTCDTIADGLATRHPVKNNVDELLRWVDEMLLVSEEEMMVAMRRLQLDEGVVAEPAAAAAAAAFLQQSGRHKGEKVVIVVTGSNVSPEVAAQSMRKS